MTTTTTDPTLQLEQAREKLGAVSTMLATFYANARALRQLVEEGENQLRAAFGLAGHGGNPLNIANSVGPVIQIIRGGSGSGGLTGAEITVARAILAVVEADPMHAESASIIEPIIAEIHAAELAEQAAMQAVADAKRAHLEALEKIKADALDKASKDPSVAKALADYEAALGAVPTLAERRGLVVPKPEPALDVPLIRGKNLATA